ncbi:MAG: hypothetical protein GY702_18225 [Desulfobulbaceae bacterium]|nr:hypothetical protein [Desulfobulbaceae bacterium]
MKGPRPEIVADGEKAKTLLAGYIKRRLRLGVPSAKNVVIGDRQYLYITQKWFMDVIRWTEELIVLDVPELGSGKEFPLGYEETFAVLASNIANIAVAKRYNLRASVLMGLITAKQEKAWGDIPVDGKVAVYIIGLTEKGGIVYDLRTKQAIGFEDFPNFDSIIGVLF